MFDAVSTKLEAEKWQRLSPAAIIYYIVKFATAFIKNGIQGLAPLAAVFFTTGDKRWMIIGLLALGAVMVLLGAALLSYLKFRYRINDDTVLIQSGVFTRKRLSLGFDRIQNVAIKEPLYFRPFSTVVLAIESAGSTASEVSLAGIPRILAEEIRAKVLETKNTAAVPASEREDAHTEQETSQGGETALLHQPIGELARYGLTSNNIWVFAGILAGASAQFDWWEYLNPFDLFDIFSDYEDTSNLLVALMAFAGTVTFVALLTGTSMLASIIIYYDYKLSHFLDGRFHRTKGLFEKQETSLPDSKIQSLTIKQPWPALLLRRYNLILDQVGFGGSVEDGSQRTTPKFLVPSVKDGFLAKLSNLIYPEFQWQKLPLQSVSKRYTSKVAFYIILPISLLPAIPMTYGLGPIGLLPLMASLLAYPFIERYRRMLGFATDGTHGIIQTGFIGTARTLIPFYKVQTVELVQSLGQRQHKLATLHIKMAGKHLAVPYIPLAEAEKWRSDILRQIETSTVSWM